MENWRRQSFIGDSQSWAHGESEEGAYSLRSKQLTAKVLKVNYLGEPLSCRSDSRSTLRIKIASIHHYVNEI